MTLAARTEVGSRAVGQGNASKLMQLRSKQMWRKGGAAGPSRREAGRDGVSRRWAWACRLETLWTEACQRRYVWVAQEMRRSDSEKGVWLRAVIGGGGGSTY